MVYVFLADGFEEVEALTPVDYLRRAGIEVVTVGVNGKTVVGARKIPVVCDTTQDKLSAEVPEAVILPGGIPGVPNLLKSSVVADTLEKTYRAGGLIAAICAAPTILSAYGYLEGKNAVCYPGMEKDLCGAHYQKERVVRDGMILTAEAAGSAELFAFEIIRILRGEKAAEKVRTAVVAR